MSTKLLFIKTEALSERIDIFILKELQKHRSLFMHKIMILSTSLGNGGLVWIILCILTYLHHATHLAYLLVFSLVLESVICNLILKPYFARPRPFQRDTSVALLIPEPHDFSFPSGHTSASFACLRSFSWLIACYGSLLLSLHFLFLYQEYIYACIILPTS